MQCVKVSCFPVQPLLLVCAECNFLFLINITASVQGLEAWESQSYVSSHGELGDWKVRACQVI